MKKPRAVFTFVFNEAIMLPIWLNYYSKYFAYEDIYVLDHSSNDGSTDNLPCDVTKLNIPAVVDCDLQLHVVSLRQAELIARYETVLYTDVDEIIVPHPSRGNLGDYISNFNREFVSCNGFVVFQKEDEPALDYSRPILDQRAWWFPSIFSCKPLLAKVPMRWALGCHTQLQKSDPQRDDYLYMLHLQRADYNLCQQRHKNVAARPSCHKDTMLGYGRHRYIADDDHFKAWFYMDDGAQQKLCLIPRELRETRIV